MTSHFARMFLGLRYAADSTDGWGVGQHGSMQMLGGKKGLTRLVSIVVAGALASITAISSLGDLFWGGSWS